MNRRSFFNTLGIGAGALVLDTERLLWLPGAKKIFVPSLQGIERSFKPYFELNGVDVSDALKTFGHARAHPDLFFGTDIVHADLWLTDDVKRAAIPFGQIDEIRFRMRNAPISRQNPERFLKAIDLAHLAMRSDMQSVTMEVEVVDLNRQGKRIAGFPFGFPK